MAFIWKDKKTGTWYVDYTSPGGKRARKRVGKSKQAAQFPLKEIEYHHSFDPAGVSNPDVTGEEGLDRLVDLLRGFFNLGGMELSLNFLNEETLRAAQRDPDRHRYLMVRLFGMSAQFVNLSPRLQENIIERVRTASRHIA